MLRSVQIISTRGRAIFQRTNTGRYMASTTDVLAGHDPEQARLMQEELILVDEKDNPCGSISKKEAHLSANDLPLHRAFSLFLFDSEGRMLLQQRAATKVTFPSYWTNTVCSHPLQRPDENGESDDGDQVLGTKRAVIRKLGHELGVKAGELSVSDLHYMTRIHYRAESDGGIWGEHELDYVFFAQKKVNLDPQPNEVSAAKYVTKEELKHLFTQAKSSNVVSLTPWFQYIVNDFGWHWWDVLMNEGFDGLRKLRDTATIHRIESKQ